ncbi:MAG TPA: hypothetical protein V6C71_26480 [Coleofasciculaceae cyanobacterium]
MTTLLGSVREELKHCGDLTNNRAIALWRSQKVLLMLCLTIN